MWLWLNPAYAGQTTSTTTTPKVGPIIITAATTGGRIPHTKADRLPLAAQTPRARPYSICPTIVTEQWFDPMLTSLFRSYS